MRTGQYKDAVILCVDDKPDILEKQREALTLLGFSVLTAVNPSDALLLIKEHHAKIALVISDYSMHGINGLEFRRKMIPPFEKIPFVILKDRSLTPEELTKLVEAEAIPRVAVIRERKELLDGFVVDANHLMEDLEPLILSLETNWTDTTLVNSIYRIVHTIKGAAGFFDTTIVKFAHRYEEDLGKIKNAQLMVDDRAFQVFLTGFYKLKYLIKTVHEPTKRDGTLKDYLKFLDLSATTPAAALQVKKKVKNAA